MTPSFVPSGKNVLSATLQLTITVIEQSMQNFKGNIMDHIFMQSYMKRSIMSRHHESVLGSQVGGKSLE